MERTEPGPEGIASLCMATGERLQADLFVDASGFRSELLGQALATPLVGFESALFCDRAVIGGWQRGHEPIKPYTTTETMDAGWCWQIEHEHFINRGYVFSSPFISDDDARAELLRKNPAIPPETTRVVKFRSGRRQELWRGNVVAIGNAGGFVEPLEATALTVAAMQLKLLVQTIWHGQFEVTLTLRGAFNRVAANHWDDTRDFLALHYRYNSARDTPFWRTCREETNLGEVAGFVDFFRENGPSVLATNALPGGRAIYGLGSLCNAHGPACSVGSHAVAFSSRTGDVAALRRALQGTFGELARREGNPRSLACAGLEMAAGSGASAHDATVVDPSPHTGISISKSGSRHLALKSREGRGDEVKPVGNRSATAVAAHVHCQSHRIISVTFESSLSAPRIVPNRPPTTKTHSAPSCIYCLSCHAAPLFASFSARLPSRRAHFRSLIARRIRG